MILVIRVTNYKLAVRAKLISSTKIISCTLFIAGELRAFNCGTREDGTANKGMDRYTFEGHPRTAERVIFLMLCFVHSIAASPPVPIAPPVFMQ